MASSLRERQWWWVVRFFHWIAISRCTQDIQKDWTLLPKRMLQFFPWRILLLFSVSNTFRGYCNNMKGRENRKDDRPTPTNQRPIYSIGYHFWYNNDIGKYGVPMRTRCEGHGGRSQPRGVMATTSSSDPRTEKNEMENYIDKSCPACLYTGVVTCTALSLYFAKLATDEVTLHSNRRFLWICSTGCFVAGAYRWYLGWTGSTATMPKISQTRSNKANIMTSCSLTRLESTKGYSQRQCRMEQWFKKALNFHFSTNWI